MLLCTFSLHAAILDDVAEKVEAYESHFFHHNRHATHRHHRYHSRHIVSKEKQWQQALRFLGYYNGKIDGDLLTPVSYHAIERFERDHQEVATGLLDNCYKPYLTDIYTQLSLKRYLQYEGKERYKVYKKKQAALKVLGYYTGKIDGHFGKKSKAALKSAFEEGKSEPAIEEEAREKVDTLLDAMKEHTYFSLHYEKPDVVSLDDDL